MTIFVGLRRGLWRYWDIPLAMEQQVVKTVRVRDGRFYDLEVRA